MLRIQKAVMKAKDAKEHQLIRQRSEAAKTNSPLESLKYTKTKVETVHPDYLEENRIVAGFPSHKQSQIFRTLRTHVIKKMRENKLRSLAVTSPSSGEGKSLVAANLAVALAMEVNQTVLLVDLDLRNPGIAKYFNIEQQNGFLDYLKGNCELEDIMVNPGIDRLVVVPGHGTAINSSEIISSPKMRGFYNETRARYKSRIVIYDLPPILPSDDVLSSISNIDSALLVLEEGRNSEKEIVRAIRQLQGTPLLGSVINKFHKGGWMI
ncbi:MAG: CpsD/CapB family tyrosine-protein kinase [Agarilytica sp.]